MSDDLPHDPNAAIIAAIAADDSRALAMALIDRVQGIVGDDQLLVREWFDKLEAVVTEVNKAQIDIRYQMAQGNTASDKHYAQIEQYFTRLFREFDTLTSRVDVHEQRLNAKRERMDLFEIELTSLKAELANVRVQVAALEAQLAARPSPEEARATYDGVQRILRHLGLEGN